MRYADELSCIEKHLDTPWKRIDEFEGSLRAYAGSMGTHRRKMNTRDGEIEALNVTFHPSPGLTRACADGETY